MLTRKWLVASFVLIALGAIVFTLSACSSGGNLSDLLSPEYSTKELVIREDFDSIVIDVTTADIRLAASDDGECRLVSFSHDKVKVGAIVGAGTLTVSFEDEREWYDHIAVFTNSPALTLYLPEAQYETLVVEATTGDIELPAGFTFGTVDISLSTGDVELESSVTGLAKVETTTGDIELENISASSIALEVTTGDVSLSNVDCGGNISIVIGTGDTYLTDVTCYNFTSDGTTGKESLVDVIASGKITITRTTGDITLERSDASELEITTSTGDVRGILLTPKIFIAESSTGRIDVPKTSEGGVCKVTTSTGDIKLDIAK